MCSTGSCSMPTSVEMYENSVAAAPSKCPSKEIMTNCLYTAQGLFICQKDLGVKSVPNEEMANWAARLEQGVAKSAGSYIKQ